MEAVEILKRKHRTALLVVKAARRDLEGAGETHEVADLEELSDAFAAIACEEPEEGVHASYTDLTHEVAATARD